MGKGFIAIPTEKPDQLTIFWFLIKKKGHYLLDFNVTKEKYGLSAVKIKKNEDGSMPPETSSFMGTAGLFEPLSSNCATP